MFLYIPFCQVHTETEEQQRFPKYLIRMASPILFSKPPPDFNAPSIFRGLQLAIFGALRTILNPKLTTDLWRTFWKLVALSIVASILYLSINLPLLTITTILKISAWIRLVNSSTSHYLIELLEFCQFDVLNTTPYIIMGLKYLDNDIELLFWSSLSHHDSIHQQTKKIDSSNERTYALRFDCTNYKFASSGVLVSKSPALLGSSIQTIIHFLKSRIPWISNADFSTHQNASISCKHDNEALLANFLASYFMITSRIVLTYICWKIPIIGRFAFPVLAFHLLYSTAGSIVSLCASFLCFIFPVENFALPLVTTFTASHQLMNLLLEPYFERLSFTRHQLDRWYFSRVGCLLGFSLFYYYLICTPRFLIGVYIFALAEGATAFLVTNVTTPPPLLASTKVAIKELDKGETAEHMKETLASSTSSSRLSDLKVLTDWTDEQCDWINGSYKELEFMLRNIDGLLSGMHKED